MSIIVEFPQREDISKMVNLDLEVFSDIRDEVEQETHIFEEWFDKNRFQWLVAKDGVEDVIGYVSLYHMKTESFEKLLKGQLVEKEMTVKDIEEFKSGNLVSCYIDGFVVRNRNSRIAIALMNKFLWYFRFLKENGIILHKAAATVVTKPGLILSNKLGFKKTLEYKPLSNGIVPALYVLDTNDLNYSRLVNEVKEIIIKNNEYL